MKNNISLLLVCAIILSGVCLAFAPAPAAKAPSSVKAPVQQASE